MPNTFIGHRERWIALSEIDYLGQFVKAWMAFNAWYRSNYQEHQDRKIINEFKWQPNPVRNKLVPLLTRMELPDADEFRAEIGLLHHRLENYSIESGRDTDKTRVTLTNTFLQDNGVFSESGVHSSYNFSVTRSQPGNKPVDVKVRNRSAVLVVNLNHPTHNLAAFEAEPTVSALPGTVRSHVRNLYQKATPRDVQDLLQINRREAGEASIKCGQFTFNCGKTTMFAGVAEILYQMRCTLFHGELEPTREASECYEPAFRILRRMLNAI